MIFKCSYNIEKEVSNHIDKLHKNTDPELKESLLKTTNVEIREIIKCNEGSVLRQELTDYFREFYEKNKNRIEQKEKFLNHAWEIVGDQIIHNIESLYKRKFPFEELKGYFTTLPIYPYSYKHKHIYVGIKENPPEQLISCMHELNHFMFHHYFGNLKNELGSEKFHIVKESLTFFTSPEDPGLKNQKKLRNLYLSRYWKNIDEAIESAVRLIKEV